MKTRKLRLLSFVLAVAMMFAILPVSAFAATSATELTVSVSKAGENGKCALEQAVSELEKTPEELAQVTTLDLDTADGIMLTIDDVTYLKNTFTAIQTLDLTDADFIDNQGDGKNNSNWKHPWKGNTVDVEHQFPDCAFSNYSGTLSTVIFGSKIKSIGAFAFSGCSSLTEVRFVNSSLEAIDNDGFRNTSISAIDIPDTVSYMGYGVFYGTKLGEVRLPNLLTELKYAAFGHCTELKKVDLNNIQKIDGVDHWPSSQCAVFLKCTKLSEIRLPATLQELGGEFTAVFNGCDIIVDATANPEIEVGPHAFESGIDANSQGGAVNGAKLTCKAFIYVQKSTKNVNASENIGVAITNGGTFAENTIFEKSKLATPEKTGYTFKGWYNNAELTGNAVTTPETNKTYYAKWEAKQQYTVSFDLNGQTGTAPAAQTVYEGDPATKPADPTAKGYTFIGWYDANGNAFDFTKPVTANTTLYAKWEAIPDHQLTVTGGTFTVKDENVETKTEGDTLMADIPEGAEVTVTFHKDAYADSNLTFDGWKIEGLVDAENYTNKEEFNFTMPKNGVTIAAQTKAAAPAEDDSLDAATVVTGVVLGTGTAILAYHIGIEVYAEQVLGKGVAIPRTREEVAFKAWELAGKPAVELNGEPLSEAAQAEKWAVESGLMQNVDGSFNGSKKMSKLKALRTLDAAKKLG